MSDKKDLIDFLRKQIYDEEIWIAGGCNIALGEEIAQARISKYREIVDILYDTISGIHHCAKCDLDLGPVYCPRCYKETHSSTITDAQQKVINMICENLNIEFDAVDMESAREFISMHIEESKKASEKYKMAKTYNYAFGASAEGEAVIECDYNGEPMF